MADSNGKVTINLDFRIISIVLVLIIAAMLVAWRPWAGAARDDRTVSVTGEATVKATPDEFVFYPTYEIKNTDRQAALDAMAKKSDELVAKLKELGVEDKDIKTNVNSYDNKPYYPMPDIPVTGDNSTYTLQLTVTADTKEEAQKIQDYLVTTSPSGAITPQPNFSTELRKQLESQARDEATKDARSKAEQSAKNLGAGLGRVKTVQDGSGFGVMPYDSTEPMAAERDATGTSLSVQPGENEINYTVSVTYYLR